MVEDRLRVPFEAGYAGDIGLAVICFAICEWNAVWCAEKIEPGYIRTKRRKTAGQIAKDLIRIAAKLPSEPFGDRLRDAATEFDRLTDRRNDLLHANPGTDADGSQRLFRDGVTWSPRDIQEFADQTTRCSEILNDILHTHLLNP